MAHDVTVGKILTCCKENSGLDRETVKKIFTYYRISFIMERL